MLKFEDDVVIAFLKAVDTAPKGAITYDKVSVNLDRNTFDELSKHCHRKGYVNRTDGSLDSRMVFATLTEKGREYLSRHTR